MWCTVVSRRLACNAISCAGGRGCYFLFTIVHQSLSVAIWVEFFIKAAKIPSRIYCGGFVKLKVVNSSSNRLRSSFFVEK